MYMLRDAYTMNELWHLRLTAKYKSKFYVVVVIEDLI